MSRIDVIIPCFNSGVYLEQSVQSALDQRGAFDALNVIVVDDRSNDENTCAILEKMRSTDRVTVLSNSGPKGSAAARNLGIKHATGDWIAFLDSDDWWPIDSIAQRLEGLKAFPDAEWIGGDFLELNRDGTWEALPRFERNLQSYDFLSPAFEPPRKPICLRQPLLPFLKQAPANTIVSMVRRNLLDRIGYFDERFLRQQDYHLFLRLAQTTSFVFVPSVVAYYRLHESNSTKSLTHTQEWRIKVLQDLLKRSEFSAVFDTLKSEIFGLHIANSYEFRKKGAFFEAARAALEAVRSAPFNTTAWRSLAGALLRRR